MSSGCHQAKSGFEGEEVHSYLPTSSEVPIGGADSPSTVLSVSDDDAAPRLSAAAAAAN